MRYVILLDGTIYQTTTGSRRSLQQYRIGINADNEGVNNLTRIFNPTAEVRLGLITNFVHVYCTDILEIELVRTSAGISQSMVLPVNRIFNVASNFDDVVIRNKTDNVVESRIIYS